VVPTASSFGFVRSLGRPVAFAMKIISLTPGTGSFHCGSCLRDHTLVKALRALGHDAAMVPMYLPLIVEETIDPEDDHPIQFGGINVYLQQKSALFRKTPRWLDGLFNARWLLRKAADRSGMTQAHELAELTISMLRGEEGHQVKELDKLIAYLETHGRPDVVSLSNGLLVGLARPLQRRLGAAVVCGLQGEDAFLDSFPEADRRRSWEALSQRVRDADVLVAASDYYAGVMRQRLNVEEQFVQVVPNGIALKTLAPPARPPATPTIGYLARLCHAKGLHTLVDAFILLKNEDKHREVKLRIAGTKAVIDEPYIAEQRAKLAAAGVAGDVEWRINLDAAHKPTFLQSISVLSVPATYGEAFGLYVIEALACGVPFVQPRHGAFGELLHHTGGGILVEPDDPAALADGLARVLGDHPLRDQLGAAGRLAVAEKFSAARMALRFVDVCEQARAAKAP